MKTLAGRQKKGDYYGKRAYYEDSEDKCTDCCGA